MHVSVGSVGGWVKGPGAQEVLLRNDCPVCSGVTQQLVVFTRMTLPVSWHDAMCS